jgi:hypothetical protein
MVNDAQVMWKPEPGALFVAGHATHTGAHEYVYGMSNLATPTVHCNNLSKR